VLGIISCIVIFIKSRLPKKYQEYVPNMAGVGLGFVIANSQGLAFAMLCGAITSYLVKRFRPKLWEKYGYPCAAGLTAGEALASLLLAGLTIGGVSGDDCGTKIGCPFGDC
jgi:uncharacterized oligopeptide transporter (OPT) family protein